MAAQTSKENVPTSSVIANTMVTALSNAKLPRQRIVQNYVLIWMDANIDQCNIDCQNTLTQLRSVVSHVHLFTQRDECIDFLTDADVTKAFLLIEGAIGKQIVPLIQDIPQLDSVYILCRRRSRHEQWAKNWPKIKGVHVDIKSICELLQVTTKQFAEDSIAVSFVSTKEWDSSKNLDQLEPSFMYTQIFKEILLKMDYNEKSVKNFVVYSRSADYGSPIIISRFENEYNDKLAIWWYTYPSFIYSLLNCALRMLEAKTIINMGFFIRDLHRQIEKLHRIQVSSYLGKPFTVYRGQGLSNEDFEKLLKTTGGLISFNNFLSTSKKQEVSLGFAQCALTKTDTVGILFIMSIDPSVSSAPFAAIDENSPLYQVELTLTADDDQQLRTLTERIRKETPGATGWERLGRLLIKLHQSDEAEELYKILLEQTSDESARAFYFHHLGYIKEDQGDYEKAISYYEKALKFFKQVLPSNHPSLATSYNNIGAVYDNMGEYPKALSLFEKALEINQKTIPLDYALLATSYNNIGGVYKNMKEYMKALSFYESALEIRLKTLPSNHPDVAQCYSNIGLVYKNTRDYSKALSFYERALEIRQKTLPSNHPDLAVSYNNIGMIYNTMGKYSKALWFYEKSLGIKQKSLPLNHPSLVNSYSNLGMVYDNMGEYSKALCFYEKSLEIKQKTLPPNHPDFAISYSNIGVVYDNMEEYSKALSFHKKTLEFNEKTLPSNHPDLATSYNNIGLTYYHMEQHSKALSFHEKAIQIRQKALSTNHPDLATSYNNIALVYDSIGEYSKAISFHEKALEIRQKTLPSNHPDLAQSYNNIAAANFSMKNYSKALSYFERAVDIRQRSLPPNHPHLLSARQCIEIVKKRM